MDQIWFCVIYYSVIAGLATMVGTLDAIIIFLYYSILHIINSLHPYRLRQKNKIRKENEVNRSSFS